MKGYKGFAPGMICRGKQYAENTVFEEDNAEIRKNGMHFCENPFDVLDHYGLVDANGKTNEFAEVEALDEAKTDDGKKFCTTKLKIGAKLSLTGFVKACIDFAFEKTKKIKSGDWSKLAASGDGCVVSCIGVGGMAKAGVGSWMTLAEWKKSEESGRWTPVCVKTEFVDGEHIQADVFYRLEDGEFVEAAHE